MRFSFKLMGGDQIAANLESQQRFKEGQERWIAFSEDTINMAVDMLPTLANTPYPTLDKKDARRLLSKEDLEPTKVGKLLLFFAGRRHEIAQELKHGANDKNPRGELGTTKEYGVIRFYGIRTRALEMLSRNDEVIWATQKDAVFSALDELLQVPLEKNEWDEYTYSGEKYWIRSYISNKNELVLLLTVQLNGFENLKIENKPCSYSDEPMRYHIFVNIGEDGKPIPYKTYLEYAEIDPYRHPGDMEIANQYLEAMLAWKPEDGIDEFMKNAGRLSQSLVCLLPVRQGTASIVEWMVRSVAFYKGILLGDFNQNNGISWDFKALITPDRETYAQWFSQNVFNSKKLVSESVSSPVLSSPGAQTSHSNNNNLSNSAGQYTPQSTPKK